MAGVGLLALALLLGACGGDDAAPAGGEPVDQPRQVAAYDEISVQSGLTAHITIGDVQTVVVRGDPSVVGSVTTTVAESRLTVALQPPDRELEPGTGPVIDIVVAPQPEQVTQPLGIVTAHDGANVTIEGFPYEFLGLEATAGATITASGATTALSIEELTGGATIDAEQLAAQLVDISASGGATARLRASRVINAELSDGAEVCYVGEPVVNEDELSGGATIGPCADAAKDG